MLTSISMHHDWDPFGSRASLLSSTHSSSDVDSESDVETIPDERILVESGWDSSHSDEPDLLPLSDVLEDEECVKPQCTSQGPPKSFESPDVLARPQITYPLPSDKELLAYEPTPRDPAIDTLFVPPPSGTALRPPPSHYKQRRGRIISDEDYDPDPDQAPIRFDSIQNPRAHWDSCSETHPALHFLGLDDEQRVVENARQFDSGLNITCSASDPLSIKS